MKDFHYLIENFFTNKDFLVPADQIPGTLFTPLHFLFAGVLLCIIVCSAVYVSRRKQLIRPVFTVLLITLVVFEAIIVAWESLSGAVVGLDLQNSLSLYPCSIFMYTMPFAIWGKGTAKRIACGSICTLGLLGASVNFFYPAIQLSSYSCISFPGIHTFFYHGTMLFTCLVMLMSNYHRYTGVQHWWELFYPCIPSLIVSIPANIINYSPIDADYMFFRGHFPLLAAIFGDTPEIVITLVLYGLYIFVPTLFYLPSYIHGKRKVPAAVE